MNEASMIHGIKAQSGESLQMLIDSYVSYVLAIVRGIIGSAMSSEDVEEVASDVFLAVWNNAGKLEEGKVKAYIGAIARNKARNKLREQNIDLSIEDDTITISTGGPEEHVDSRELAGALQAAIDALPSPDREIFWRYYYYYQTTEHIASALDLNAATVRTKLARGRKKLGEILYQRGYTYEDQYN